MTLSKGQFQEFFPNDTIVRIGTVLFNTVTQENRILLSDMRVIKLGELFLGFRISTLNFGYDTGANTIGNILGGAVDNATTKKDE